MQKLGLSPQRGPVSEEPAGSEPSGGGMPCGVGRGGFTLVEMLMVLIIAGILASLLTVAVSYAIQAAKRAAITVEVGNIDTAMQDYKSRFGGEYPPCMAIPPLTTATSPVRSDLFNRALRKRFPRFTGDYSSLRTLLYSGGPGTPATPPAWTVNLIGGGTANLDLDNLDAAEALVFWLAGPPAPTSAGVSTILYGFCANPTSPFSQSGSRTEKVFDFDESRLTDVDNDGWPEYTPQPSANIVIGPAPYVYFDPSSYTYSVGTQKYYATYPGFYAIPPSTSAPTQSWPTSLPFVSTSVYATNSTKIQTLCDNWGFVTPYANSMSTAWNEKKFQLLSAGLDSEYGGSQFELQGKGRYYGAIVPQRATQGSQQYLTIGDNDNQSNFISGRLEDYVPQ